MSFDQPFHTLH